MVLKEAQFSAGSGSYSILSKRVEGFGGGVWLTVMVEKRTGQKNNRIIIKVNLQYCTLPKRVRKKSTEETQEGILIKFRNSR